MEQGKVKAICISSKRGTVKENVHTANLTPDWGIEGDAHGGNWHRQVSLLSFDKVEDFNQKGASVDHGDFGENIVVEGIDFKSLPVGTKLQCGDAILEVTQIGKECHTHCQIYHRMGDCIMPREGVFARVLQRGSISENDVMTVLREENTLYRAAVITLSDKGFEGIRADESGPQIVELLKQFGFLIVDTEILPDDQEKLKNSLIDFADRRKVDLIFTTGGTGFAERDITPEATLEVADRDVPGIAEAMRANSMLITPKAMFSRAVSVIRGKTLIINLPGSPKAVKEHLEFLLPNLDHALEVLRGEAYECANIEQN